MGMLDKVMFWKKEPKLDLDTNLDLGPDPLKTPGPEQGMENQQLGLGQMPDFSASAPSLSQPQMPIEQPHVIHDPVQSQQPLQGEAHDKNLEIISMKLDNIKASIENMNQRLINIERIAIDSKQEPKRRQW